MLFKPRSIRYLDQQGGYYSKNLKAIKREKLTRPRDIALQLAHKDEVIDFVAHKVKAAITLRRSIDNSAQVGLLLEEVLQKIMDED